MITVLLIGSEGSMGVRYQAIFNYLNIKYIPFDKDYTFNKINYLSNLYTHILLCTPTDTHLDILKEIIPLNKNILCEKPICKSSDQVKEIIELVKKSKSTFKMVFQYKELIKETREFEYDSIYNYFRTGKDGLYWDCLQIIALARGKIFLRNKSPYWQCTINGETLFFSDMDYAYVIFIKKWLNGEINQDYDWLINIHKKVEDYERQEKDKCINSNPS